MLHIWVVAAAAEENIFTTIRARCCVTERAQRGRETQPVFLSAARNCYSSGRKGSDHVLGLFLSLPVGVPGNSSYDDVRLWFVLRKETCYVCKLQLYRDTSSDVRTASGG